MPNARQFLIRGLIAGLLAGFAAFAVAYVLGEPSVNAAIAVEQTHDQAEAHADSHDQTGGTATEVPRSLQSTAGLLTATVVAGATLGGLVGVVSALGLGRFGSAGARTTTLGLTAAAFVATYVLPYLAYPPNPPAVGNGETIGYRTALYFTYVAISIVAGVTAVLVGRRLAGRIGGWYAALVVAGAYLVVMAIAGALMPSYNEVPGDFPATVLASFRQASMITQITLWGVLGLVLAEFVHRLTRRSAAPGRELSHAAL